MKKLYKVAVLVESTRAYSRELIRGIAQYNREHLNWEIEFTPRGLNEPSPAWIKDWHGDGILARINDKRLFQTLLKKKIPVVDFRRSFSSPDIPRIGPDDSMTVSILFDFFRSRGFRHFGFIGIPCQLHAPMDVRRETCRRIVDEQGLSYSELEIAAQEFEGDRKQGLRKLVQWLRRLPKHVAVIACNDDLAMQVLIACRKIGLAVPDEIGVAGIGNDDCLCELATPTLTSVELNPKRIGYLAAEMLQEMMDRSVVPPQSTLIKPNFIVSRMSTNIVSTEDPVVNRALQFIWGRACDGLQVKDVLQHVRLSRMGLENRIKKILGHTVFQEILNVRLQRVKELLSTTDLTIKEIARHTGFGRPEHLMRVFRNEFGQTMKSFRKDYGGR